ncbi:MAG: molecular chaperone Tir [Planctomycetia bacterium 21-64-5]|nr:MAG: molecular chaperone Tir [Planctomycetia bacterium 21-64-5]
MYNIDRESRMSGECIRCPSFGQVILSQVLKALQRCDWFVVLLSPDAIESMWVRRETALALRDKRFEDKIIPVRYRPCDLGRLGWLEIFQMVDFQGDFDQGCRNLLRIWGIGLKSHR